MSQIASSNDSPARAGSARWPAGGGERAGPTPESGPAPDPARRQLMSGLAGAPSLLSPVVRPAWGQEGGFPFTLGVASGYPTPDGFVAWTRLARDAHAPDGGMGPTEVPVRCEVADDEAFRQVRRRTEHLASARNAHVVRVDVRGLAPGRWYWYRFEALGHRSRAGRSRTAPAADAAAALRIGIASCAHYEQGWFGAYRAMSRDGLDLIAHVGDYIYESSWGRRKVRSFGAPEPTTLEAYRRRFATYRLDPDLQDAHAACPWVCTWDDHEVDNDYAGERSEHRDPPDVFLARRAAAYQAYFEHMPLPSRMAPRGPAARIHTALRLGRLASVILLDERQYRSPQACPREGRGGGNVVRPHECPELGDVSRSMLGAAQEQWLGDALARSGTQWTLIAQQTLLAPMNLGSATQPRFWTDGWSGYPAARQRLLDQIARSQARNPVVLGGDVHCYYVTDLHRIADDPRSPRIATEFVGTSITSESRAQKWIAKAMRENPHVRYGNGESRGYLRLAVDGRQARADHVIVDDVHAPDSGTRRAASFVVEDGRPGAQREA